jgi:hypothetical protein
VDEYITDNPLSVRDDQPLILEPVFGSGVITSNRGPGTVTLAEPWETFRQKFKGRVPHGTVIQVLSQPEFGYYTPTRVSPFAQLIDSPKEGTYTFTSEFLRLSVTNQLLTVLLAGEGGVDLNPSRNFVPTGETIALTAKPASNSFFVGWSGATNSNMPKVSIVMTTNKTITATFQEIPPSLAITRESSASIHLQTSKLPWTHYWTERSTDLVNWDFWQNIYDPATSAEIPAPPTGENSFFRIRKL